MLRDWGVSRAVSGRPVLAVPVVMSRVAETRTLPSMALPSWGFSLWLSGWLAEEAVSVLPAGGVVPAWASANTGVPNRPATSRASSGLRRRCGMDASGEAGRTDAPVDAGRAEGM